MKSTFICNDYCSELNGGSPKVCPCPNFRPCDVTLFRKRFFMNEVKDLEMRGVLWINQVGPKWHCKCPSKRVAEAG